MSLHRLRSLNPFAAWLKPAPTQQQIILYDLKLKQRQLVDAHLERIRLEHERAALKAQFDYLQALPVLTEELT